MSVSACLQSDSQHPPFLFDKNTPAHKTQSTAQEPDFRETGGRSARRAQSVLAVQGETFNLKAKSHLLEDNMSATASSSSNI